MNVEMNPAYALLCSMMSVIDMTLTYYILWYDRKLNPKTARFQELNPLARKIMKMTNLGPWGLILGALTSQALILFVLYLAPVEIGYYAIVFMTGAIFLAVWVHTHSIRTIHKYAKGRVEVRSIVGEPLGQKD
jgi:hypothetical protein